MKVDNDTLVYGRRKPEHEKSQSNNQMIQPKRKKKKRED